MDTSLNTIEKLVHFGMTMAVAQQMVNTLNHSISKMIVPGVDNNPQLISHSEYYVVNNGLQVGPISETILEEMIITLKISRESLVWRPGMTGWTQASNVPEINKIFLLNGK